MVLELVTGMMLGLAIGYGLDVLFGTRPFLLIIFALLGFAAGIKTMMGTAKQMAKDAGTSATDERD
jgi:ATP synthase protein I